MHGVGLAGLAAAVSKKKAGIKFIHKCTSVRHAL